MAHAKDTYTADGSTQSFLVSFPFISRDHVTVTADGSTATFTWVNDGQITITSPASLSTEAIVIKRNTSPSAVLVDFEDGSNLTETDLDLLALQSFYLAQENIDEQGSVGFADLDGFDDAIVATSGNILVGDGTEFDSVTMSGDATINSSGVVALGTGVIVDADVNASAAISASKVQYIDTVTSDVQAQIDAVTAGTLQTIDDDNLTIQDEGDNTKKGKFQLSGVTTGNTRTITWPDADVTIPTTFVTPSTSDTFTNKSIDLANNTLASTLAQLNTAISDATLVSNAITASSTDTLTNKTIGASTLSGAMDGADQQVKKINLLDYGEVTNAIGSTGGGTQDIDLTLGNSVTATVDTSTNTFTFSNPTASDEGCSFDLFLTNGGSQTVNWPASVDWAGATAPTLTTSGVDWLVFATKDGGTIWNGAVVGLDMS
jgi:hypothetical protein